MALIRYRHPHSLLSEIQDEMNRLFTGNFPISDVDDSNLQPSEWLPAVDIKEDDKQFTLFADIPGVDPNAIEVHVEDGLLSIRGQRHSETTSENHGYKRVERSSGSFFRRFSLPETADAENIQAKGKHGVLEIVIPKTVKPNGSRKIQVSTE